MTSDTPVPLDDVIGTLKRILQGGVEWAPSDDAALEVAIATLEKHERAMAALQPFATAAEDLSDEHKDHHEIWESPAAMGITAGDLRRARKALDAAQETDDAHS